MSQASAQRQALVSLYFLKGGLASMQQGSAHGPWGEGSRPDHAERMKRAPRWRRVDPAALEAAHRMLQPFCLRRLKADVEKSLPPRARPSASATLNRENPNVRDPMGCVRCVPQADVHVTGPLYAHKARQTLDACTSVQGGDARVAVPGQCMTCSFVALYCARCM